MNPAHRALWLLENRLWDTELDLDAVAREAMVSKFHLSRCFRWATGLSVMGYLRARRLTEAARTLTHRPADTDLLDLALRCGYASHEAFSRAFRRRFGVSPSEARDRGVPTTQLLEARPMPRHDTTTLAPPRFEDRPSIHLVGRLADAGSSDGTSIPAQWGEFVPHLDRIPGRVGDGTVGALFQNDDESIEYLCAVEVDRGGIAPSGLVARTLDPQRYAVFHHEGHVASIRSTWHSIWSGWLPTAEVEPVAAPALEIYGSSFDPISGLGGLDLWIPVTASPR